jgi:predicted kinase
VHFTKDDGVFVLVEFYKCYRALVRAKVNCLTLQESGSDIHKKENLMKGIERYMELAYRYALQFTRPTLWVVCGMIASGKSTISSQLAQRFNIRVLRTDVIRKKLFNLPCESRIDASFEEGPYSQHATALAYGKLMRKAQQELEKGYSVILDGTFSSRHWRNEAFRLVEDMDANIIFIETTASRSVLKDRLKKRELESSVSDARLVHFQKFEASYEPLADIPDKLHFRIDTEKPLKESIQQILLTDYYLLSEKFIAKPF